jgi:hypothetical protein
VHWSGEGHAHWARESHAHWASEGHGWATQGAYETCGVLPPHGHPGVRPHAATRAAPGTRSLGGGATLASSMDSTWDMFFQNTVGTVHFLHEHFFAYRNRDDP